MKFFTKDLLEDYAKNDHIGNLLAGVSNDDDQLFISHRWLLDSLPKRMIFQYMYGDLLSKESSNLKIIDVGGGYTALTKLLLKNHSYTLVDIMSHDNHQQFLQAQKKLNGNFWIGKDWFDFEPKGLYDVIIANDLFPNVDQRLEQFIERFIPISRGIRISLTYYNEPRFYKVKRADADETFYILAWNGFQVAHTLERFSDRITNFKPELFLETPESLFENGRLVAMITVSGNL